MRNSWSVVEKYATTVVYVGTHLFPQFLEKSGPPNNACNTLHSSKKKKTRIYYKREIDESTENLSGIDYVD